jgi:hypothetical protein
LRAQEAHTQADSFEGLARSGLTDLGHFFECRHFDFWPLSAVVDGVVNSMTQISRFVQRKVLEVDVTDARKQAEEAFIRLPARAERF